MTQYSLHVSCDPSTSPPTLTHRDYLLPPSTHPSDLWPRLLKDLPPTGSVVVYSSYERTQLLAAARDNPSIAGDIRDVVGRLWDLEKAVKLVAKKELRGRTSIKVALGAFAPTMGAEYERLAASTGVADGGAAQSATVEHLDGSKDWGPELREYCELDTMAMVEVLEGVKEAWNGLDVGAGVRSSSLEVGGGEDEDEDENEIEKGKVKEKGLEDLTVKRLKEMCRKRELKLGGRKADLIDRLRQHVALLI